MGERGNPLMKKMDKWIGSPLIFGIGALHKKKKLLLISNIASPRIAIIKTAGIGDTIILSAIIDEIKANITTSQITLICAKNNLAMVQAMQYKGIDEICAFDMKAPIKSLNRVRQLGNFDYAIDFGPWPRINALIAMALHASYRVGFKRRKQYRHYAYDGVVEHSDNVHELENCRNLIRKIGISTSGLQPNLHTSNKFTDYANYAVFHMHAGGSIAYLREWDVQNWLQLAREVHEKYHFKLLFSGGSADKADIDQLVDRIRGCGIDAENIAGKYALSDMAAVLQNAQLLVSVNTGTMHLGAAVGVPLVAIHGASAIKRWGPLSDNAISLASKRKCWPCVSLGYETDCKKADCIEDIGVSDVMAAIEKLLEKSTPSEAGLEKP